MNFPVFSSLTRVSGCIAAIFTAIFLLSSVASAQVVFDGSAGTAAPPETLGSYPLIQFAPNFVLASDGPVPNNNVLAATVPLQAASGLVLFSGHLYRGVVYTIPAGTETFTILLPPNTMAFSFYIGAKSASTAIAMTKVGGDIATSGPVSISGPNGARFFGFYTENGASLDRVTITSDGKTQLYIGEFGIGLQ